MPSNNEIPQHPVAEFLFQLVKMLTDDNSHYIEWIDGEIKVHDPQGVADNVLGSYFRHSKYASFQRQLNYFGFRKHAGKGKMSPCSYSNEVTNDDLKSLLQIRRKATVCSKRRRKSSSNTVKTSKKARFRASAKVEKEERYKEKMAPIEDQMPSKFRDHVLSEEFDIDFADNVLNFALATSNNHIVQNKYEIPSQSADYLNIDLIDKAKAAMEEAVNAATQQSDFFEHSLAFLDENWLCGHVTDDSNSEGGTSCDSSLVDLAMLPRRDAESDDGHYNVTPSSTKAKSSSMIPTHLHIEEKSDGITDVPKYLSIIG